MNIRTENAGDYEEVFQLNYLAFGNRESESKLIEKIRLSEQFIPELSLVAEEDSRITGHALFSKAEVIDREDRHEVIVLAPIAVLPTHQKRGIGGRLIEEGLLRSKQLGFAFVFLIGHLTYYPRFGFQPARAEGFELKQFNVSDRNFMVRKLSAGGANKFKGGLRYPKSFF